MRAPGRSGQPWSDDELLLCLNLYFRLPFSRYDQRTPDVIEVASAIGRTPSSVALRLANYASLDPSHHARGIRGMSNISRGAREMWERYASDREMLAFEGEVLRSERLRHTEPRVGRERDAMARTRVNQGLFRRMMLARYEGRCLLTGLPVPELLVASHIVRWADDPQERLNPENGLLLNALHDRAFEVGLLTISDDLRAEIDRDRVAVGDSAAAELLVRYDGQALALPPGVGPSVSLLRRHRDRVAAA